jgi:hypothetical protein
MMKMMKLTTWKFNPAEMGLRFWYEVRNGEQVYGPFASMAEAGDFVVHNLVGDVEIYQFSSLLRGSRKISKEDYKTLRDSPETLLDPYTRKLG